MHVEEKGKAAVAFLEGTQHKFYEDRYRLLCEPAPIVVRQNRGEIFAVFDGIGSAPKGREAAQEMCDRLGDFYTAPQKHPADFQSMSNLLMDANQRIHSWGFMPGTDRPLGGCAGTVIWIYGGVMYVFHAGDTIALLIRDDTVRQLTRLHEMDGGIFYYFGLGENLKIDIGQHPIEESDRIVMMSDGVSKAFFPAEIAAIVGEYHDKKIAAGELVRRSRLKGSSDDITAVVIDIEDIEDVEV